MANFRTLLTTVARSPVRYWPQIPPASSAAPGLLSGCKSDPKQVGDQECDEAPTGNLGIQGKQEGTNQAHHGTGPFGCFLAYHQAIFPHEPVMDDLKPIRTPWNGFPDVIIHSPELAVKKHVVYAEAKAGDSDAAFLLVQDTISPDAVEKVIELAGARNPLLASAHAFEKTGVNAIPEALADELAERTGFPVDGSIVQINVVGHTGANGFSRLARQALFDGDVVADADYLLVDDFIGQGGTLANLKGYIESKGGKVIGATVLTGKDFSAKIALTNERLATLRAKHEDLEDWWQARFGHGFDRLTESEARYLERTNDADTIRNRITETE